MTTSSRTSTTKMFQVFLCLLAIGGPLSAWAVSNSLSQARIDNFQAVKAERTQFWKSYVGATNAPGDAERVQYIASHVQGCAPSSGETTITATRTRFVAREYLCLAKLRRQLATQPQHYDRLTVLVDWVVENAT